MLGRPGDRVTHSARIPRTKRVHTVGGLDPKAKWCKFRSTDIGVGHKCLSFVQQNKLGFFFDCSG